MNDKNKISQYIIEKKLLKELPVIVNKMAINKKEDKVNIRTFRSKFYATNRMVSFAPYKIIF